MKNIVLLVFALFLFGCATPYQESGYLGGYSEIQLSEDSFLVKFVGNQYTSSSKASDFALLRSAEIAQIHGYKYFIIVDKNSYTTSRQYKSDETTKTETTYERYGDKIRSKSKSTTSGGNTYNITSPSTENTIVCYKTKPTDINLVYDVKILIKSLRAKYELNDTK